MAKARRWVYFFGGGRAEGSGLDKELLGGKGAGLAEMTKIGLPVPPGFTITTEACAEFHQRDGRWPTGLDAEVRQALAKLEKTCRKKLGAPNDPLLVSVRSGAARSMPGMMETILNLGLNDRSVEGLAKASDNRRFALDAYRRLIMMYGSTAMGIDREHFEDCFDHVKRTRTRTRLGSGTPQKILDTDVSTEELEHLIGEFKQIYREHCGEDFPQNPVEQLKGAIAAVFGSWMAEKAVTYRRVERITGLAGTAVNVCQMVFGNMGEDCGTGVCFTRDPSTGEPTLYGDMLINAQGEDVVAGIRTPLKLEELATRMPEVYDQLQAVRVMLEVHYKDMQDLEFTIERNQLYMLQCRAGKRSPGAAFRIAVDQASRGLLPAATARRLVKKKYLPKKYATPATKPVISKDEAIHRISPTDIERLFYPVLDPSIPREHYADRRIAEGIGAVPGAACGEIVFSAERAEARADSGNNVILVRKETSPEDVGGMYAAAGILTATGGKTSHAAVVARGWGKCCIVGCDELRVDYKNKTMTANGAVLREGDFITLDGNTGQVYEGHINLVRPEAPPEYITLMEWCDKRRRLRVRTNADTPEDARRAVELGAEGIGLCRTEHMFFDPAQPERINAMREMILAENGEDRRRALGKLIPFQRGDFEGIFRAMDGRPVTIRLLDPPLHEFLPQHDNVDGQQAIANELGVPVETIQRRVEQLHEVNPMLGHRGCRLSITYPEILDMQVRAIVEAAVACKRDGVRVRPEIMIPLSIDPKELAILVDRVRVVADATLKEQGLKVPYLVGTMVETPRAALLAGGLAGPAEFFSFGTNDLTQMTMGLSRDDAGRFLPTYVDETKAGVFNDDPFQTLDVPGVGLLVRQAVEQGRAARPKLKLGICGEHGGDPASILFCEQVGLDYVSCSPYRVPIARLASAQATTSPAALGPRVLKTNSKPKSAVRPGKTSGKATRKGAARKTAKRRKSKSKRA
jgi:pyruvate,orthophosphate dikinase